MSNLFEALSLPCELSVSKEAIDEAWRSQSQKFHPDLAGPESVDISSRLNEAREALSKPAGRLAEWLKVKCGEPASRNAALSEALMSLFSEVGTALREADQTILAIKKAQSALARSLLAPRAITAQKAIQAQLATITGTIEKISRRFPEFEKSGQGSDFHEAQTALGELKFLEKWQRECQQRLLELISID